MVVFLTEFTSPYSLNTQRGWHTSECLKEISDKRLLRNMWDYNLLLRRRHALYFQGNITLNANRSSQCQWGAYNQKNIWLQCTFCRPESILQIRLGPQQLKSQHVYEQHINKCNSHFNNTIYTRTLTLVAQSCVHSKPSDQYMIFPLHTTITSVFMWKVTELLEFYW